MWRQSLRLGLWHAFSFDPTGHLHPLDTVAHSVKRAGAQALLAQKFNYLAQNSGNSSLIFLPSILPPTSTQPKEQPDATPLGPEATSTQSEFDSGD